MPLKTGPFIRGAPRPQAARPIPFGDTRPAGWLLHQMQHDLEHGFAGCLDQLVPELFKGDDIYGRDRITRHSSKKNLGTVSHDESLPAQQMWWNSETQSNWLDGLIRTAVLTAHPPAMQRARYFVGKILESQDEDGYLGIYTPDLRFDFAGENGELWAQASLMRGLLAYYEATREEAVLQAVERAVAVTTSTWPPGGTNPFRVGHSVCGVEHGLMFTDVVDRLHYLTDKREYQDYAHWLYEAFSLGTTAERDAAAGNLLDPAYRFCGHGAHTYEHLRAVVNACYASDNPELQRSLDGYLDKLRPCLAPSGGPIGDEIIGGRDADPATTGYEYCSLLELLDSYCNLLHKSGEPAWAEQVEWLFFNAAQGARAADGRSVAYCNADDVTGLIGHLDLGAPDNPEETRFKYSPVHQDTAVCCAPNSVSIHPYYVQNMWQRRGNALALNLYGPSLLDTELDGCRVRISQQTQYPFGRHVTFNVSVSQPIELVLMLRKPTWADRLRVSGVGVEDQQEYLVLSRIWQGDMTFTVFFEAAPKVETFRNGSRYVRYGPLLFAWPIDFSEAAGRNYPLQFHDSYYRAAGETAENLRLPLGATFVVRKGIFEESRPWQGAVELHGELIDAANGQVTRARLVPMGSTILRRVTFRPA